MKRLLTAALVAVALVGAPALTQAKSLKMAYDADPVSLDPHEQLSGGTLQLSHMIFPGTPPKNSSAWRWQERKCSWLWPRLNSTYIMRL